jgi:uncharacterized protein (DUF924 family)
MSRTSNDAFNNTESEAQVLLEFWFGDASDADNVKQRGKLWFSSTAAQDRTLRDRFGALHERAARGELDAWMTEPRTALALVLLLDQFTRNLYRGTASAFSNDARALGCSKESIERKFDSPLHVPERAFLYMPFQHAETMEDQTRSVQLFGALMESAPEQFKDYARTLYEYAVLHRDIVQRFGRFPHRNELLGRVSTDGEKQYLDQGGHRFGQG